MQIKCTGKVNRREPEKRDANTNGKTSVEFVTYVGSVITARPFAPKQRLKASGERLKLDWKMKGEAEM